MHPLDDARRKIARAEEHRKQLESAVRAFEPRSPYAIVGKFEPETSEYIFWIRVFEQPPDTFALGVGDIVQNLRAALEHIAWQLVALNEGNPGRQTGFPIFRSPDDYRDKAPRLTQGMSESALALMEETQPYNVRPDNPATDLLWILNELARIDRHRLLNTVTATLVSAALNPARHRDVGDIKRVSYKAGRGDVLKDGAELMRVDITTTGPDPKMTVNGTTAAAVILDSSAIEGFPAGQLLDLGILNLLWMRCKGIWDQALSEFPESFEGVERPAEESSTENR